MHKRIYWFVGFFIFLLLATFIFYGVKMYMVHWYMTHHKEPPVTVSTTKVIAKTWHPFLSAVGSLKSTNGVDVNTEVSGQVQSIHFQSGDRVKKGDMLVQLDDQIDQQNLERDMAKLRLDKLDYARKQKLLAQNAVARSAVDTARAAYLQSMAAVASDRVMLTKKKIRAPFDGKLGIRQVDVGEYLTAGKGVVTLQALDPLYVDFSLPEQFLPKLYKGQPIKIVVDAYPHKSFSGKIIALNAKIDVGTRSIEVRAIVPNKNEHLYPGLFADVSVILPEKKNVMTVPQTAVSYSLYGDSVYTVVAKDSGKSKDKKGKRKGKKGKPEFIAVQKYVTVGERRDTIVAIKSGVKVGDTVVTAGQIKLHPNARVIINNTIKLNQ